MHEARVWEEHERVDIDIFFELELCTCGQVRASALFIYNVVRYTPF